VCNAIEKTFESKWNKGMTWWVKNQTPIVGFAHDFKHV
jgi:hypothetical protein